MRPAGARRRRAEVADETADDRLLPFGLGAAGPHACLPALIWSRLHGIVSLEIAGNWASMGLDPGQLFEAQLATLTT